LLQAQTTGHRVEAVGERTETRTVWANPDGTVRADLSSAPIRTRVDGDWVSVDYTLHRVGDRIQPVASETKVSFSAGSGDLVTIDDGGDLLSLGWPGGQLPEPALSGATATYGEVLPGVDLVMTATPGGFTQVLNVKTRQAAQSPELDELRFPTEVAPDSTVETTVAGGFEVEEATGEPAFVAPEPVMWDSLGAVSGPGAAEGDQIETMQPDTSGGDVIVVPDQGMLDDPDTVFPVFIDPAWDHIHSAGRAEWTMLFKQYPGTEFYNWDNETSGLGEGVGFQNATGVSTKRLIWEYDLSYFPNNADIRDVDFRVTETWSWSCTAAPVSLDRVGLIGSGTNWNNQPSQINSGNLAQRSVQVRPSGSCNNEWTEVTFDSPELDGSVKNALDENRIALRLSANESDPVGWKRFRNGAVLSVSWNRPPNEPTDVGLVRNDGPNLCRESGEPRAYPNWAPPGTSMSTLSGRISDPDDDSIRARFEIERETALGSWVAAGDAGQRYWWSPDYVASPKTFTRDLPGELNVNGEWVDAKYRFRMNGFDKTFNRDGEEVHAEGP
jgi:hypothetical protein